MIRRTRTLGLWLGAAALLPAAAPAQRSAPEPQGLSARPQVAFPAALTLAVGIGSFGNRAEADETSPIDSIVRTNTYSLVRGLTAAARLQSPVGRQLGLMLAASVAYRAQATNQDGEPLSASNRKVLSLRGEAGALFRFKPAAPIFFGASFVYQRHTPAPVVGQTASSTTESGGGFGIGYEFERRAGSNTSARLEMWNYWMSPGTAGLPAGYRSNGYAHDFVLTLGVTRRITPVRRRG